MSYKAELAGVERVIKKEGESTLVTYQTPIGSVSCRLLYTEDMKQAGISIHWISEHVIKEPKDYRTLGYIFRNVKVLPDYENYLDFQREINGKGLAVTFGSSAGSPMHHIMKDFLDASTFYYELYDHPREMAELCEDLASYYERIFEVLANSPAEVIFWGGNYDEMITYPPFFREHIMPYLQKFSDMLHLNGKLLLSHCDGENKSLLDLIVESGLDIAEAICPHPMTKVTISEVKRAFKGTVVVLGGIPILSSSKSACPMRILRPL